MDYELMVLEFSRLQRAAIEQVKRRIIAEQLGEGFNSYQNTKVNAPLTEKLKSA